MKRILSLLLAVVFFALPLHISASAVEVNSTVPAVSGVQPRLNRTVTITLGNAWQDVWDEGNWDDADLTVKNSTTSAYDVCVRIVSSDHISILQDQKTIPAGKSDQFKNIPSGGYIIQAKSADDVVREYTLQLMDQYA